MCMRAYSIRIVPESWTDFMLSIRHGEDETQEEIANRAGGVVDQTTIGRWLKGTGGQPTAVKAIAFAKAVGESPIRALLALRYLDPEDIAGEVRLIISSTELTDDALLQELSNRLHTRRGQSAAPQLSERELSQPNQPNTEGDEEGGDADHFWSSDAP